MQRKRSTKSPAFDSDLITGAISHATDASVNRWHNLRNLIKWALDKCTMGRGSAAAQCGEAPPHRRNRYSFEAAPRKYGGVASMFQEMVVRKGGAFPHCAAAKPLNGSRGPFLCRAIQVCN